MTFDAVMHWITFVVMLTVTLLYFRRTGQLRDRPGNSGADFAARLMIGGVLAVVSLGLFKRAAARDDFELIHWPILVVGVATIGTFIWVLRTDAVLMAERDERYERWGVVSTMVVRPAGRWGKAYWRDFAERVGSTALYALLTLIPAVSLDAPVELVWTALGVPVLLSACKGLLANMRSSETGASLLPADGPGPVLTDDRAEQVP